MPPDDVLADPYLRVLAVPLLERGGQVTARLGRDLRRVRRPQRPGRPGGLRRAGKPVPGVDGDQVRAAQRRLLERERQRSGDILGVADAYRDLTVYGGGLLPDHDDRAGGPGGG